MTLNRFGSDRNPRAEGEESAVNASEMITRSRSQPWNPCTVPTRRASSSISSSVNSSTMRCSIASAWARKGETIPIRAGSPEARPASNRSRDDRDRTVDLGDVDALVVARPGNRVDTDAVAVVIARVRGRDRHGAAVEVAGREPDQVRRAAEMLGEHDRRRRRGGEIEQAQPADVEQADVGGVDYPLRGDRFADRLVRQERDVAQLARVTDHDQRVGRAAAPARR